MHLYFIRYLLLSIGLLFHITLLAQENNTQWRGHVVNAADEAIPAATVLLYDSGSNIISSTSTDSLGRFMLNTNKTGSYTLSIQHMGYQEYQRLVLDPAKPSLGTIVLVAAHNTLATVAVLGKKSVYEVAGGAIIFNVENSIGAQDVSALEALKRAPGVSVENESNLTLQGKNAVQIRIDGRLTNLSGQDLIDFLKSISSNTIKAIEIINSPSAKYDAAGSAGIINIRTKKNLTTGLHANLSSTVAYGVSPKQLQNIGLNYRMNKVNIFANYNHTLGNYNYIYGTNRQQNNRTYDSHTVDVDKRQKMLAQLGMDYYINDKSTVGFMANGNFIFGGGLTETATAISGLNVPTLEQTLDATNDYYGQSTARYNFNVNYKYEDTLGNSLNVDADYGSFDKWNKNLQSNIYRDQQQVLLQENYYRTLNDIAIDLKGIKVDYSMNLATGKLETGIKYSQIGSNNGSQFFHVFPLADSIDDRRSNSFHFTESIAAAYVNYKKNIDTWTFEAGFRVENANSEGTLFFRENEVLQEEKTQRKATNLFPFFSITMLPNASSSLSLSYAKRIERPVYQDLNPFIYMLDELSFWQGNPFLNPAITHRLTLLYALKKSTIVTFNFAYTDQFTAKVTDTLDGDKIVMISKNLGIQKHWSLALTQNYNPKPWWDITFNGLFYYIQNEVSFDVYRNFNLEQVAGRVNVIQSFQLPYKLKAEVAAVYNSKRLSGANTLSRANSQVDIALHKSILKDKGALRLAVNDIYKGNRSRYSQNFPGFTSSSYGYYESRQIRLTFSYKFSSGSTKAQRARKSALENESGRM